MKKWIFVVLTIVLSTGLTLAAGKAKSWTGNARGFTYGRALLWATAFTFAGSVAAALLAEQASLGEPPNKESFPLTEASNVCEI